jgi:uncharacterized protein
MTTVLAAIDNSPAARPVLQAARLFAALLDAAAVAVHVRGGPARTARAEAAAVGVPLRLADGAPVDVLRAALADAAVVLGVFGARRHLAGARPAGHTTLAAASTARKPVLVVPPDARVGAPGDRVRVIVPHDGSPETDRGAAHARRLFRATAVEVTLLHAFAGDTVPRFWDEPQHEAAAWAREFVKRHWPATVPAVRLAAGAPASAVLGAAEARACDVIALVWGQELGADHARVVRDVLADARVPVLLLPLAGPAGTGERNKAMTPRTWLVDIPETVCRELVAAAPLGRIAVLVDGRPEIFPVSHVYDGQSGCVLFPTNAGTKLHAALSWPWLAFEVDGLEADGTEGWSVLVVGHAEEVKDARVIAQACAQRALAWRTGKDVRWLRIVPAKVTGRRISATGGDPL